MDITAETIQKIIEVSAPVTSEHTDAHGVVAEYSSKPLHQTLAKAPALAECVHTVTLRGIKDLVTSGIEGEAWERAILHIENETTVTIKSKDTDEYGRREDLIQAKPVPFTQFRFGQWLGQEEFVIGVASLFAETPDKDYVLKLASTLTQEAVRSSEDNGFAQKVTAKAGIRTQEQVTLKPRVDLAPFRTFPEIPQPMSAFIFRAKCDGESKPMLMLVEADGGMWKIQAMAEIQHLLETFDLKIPIIS
jgi:hypothetical protein